jgi:hypothetical protein
LTEEFDAGEKPLTAFARREAAQIPLFTLLRLTLRSRDDNSPWHLISSR